MFFLAFFWGFWAFCTPCYGAHTAFFEQTDSIADDQSDISSHSSRENESLNIPLPTYHKTLHPPLNALPLPPKPLSLASQRVMDDRDLLTHIFSFLDPNDVQRMAPVSQNFRDTVYAMPKTTLSVNFLSDPSHISFQQIMDMLRTQEGLRDLILNVQNFEHLDKNHFNLLGKTIKTHPGLRSVSILAPSISFSKIAEAEGIFSYHPTLRYIDLSGNKIDDQTNFAIISFLNKNTTLEHLNLSHNYLSGESSFDLLKTFLMHPTMTHLNLSHNHIVAPPPGKDKALSLNDPAPVFIPPAGVMHQHIDMSNNPFSPTGVMESSALFNHYGSRLRDINMDQCGINDLGVFSFMTLFHQHGVETLRMAHNKIGYSGYKDLITYASEHPTLRTLILHHNSIYAPAHDTVDHKPTHITYLDMSHNPLGRGPMENMANGWRYSPLKVLDVSSTELGLKGAESIGHYIAQNPLLDHLSISNNGLDALSAMPIVDGIRQNNGLMRLDMDHNPLGGQGGCALLNAALYHVGLKQLNIGYADLNHDLMSTIHFLLKVNKVLKQLMIQGNEDLFGTYPADDIRKMILSNMAPRKIIISSIQLADEDIDDIEKKLDAQPHRARLEFESE